ncbi:MAG: hypothetical protein D6744_05915 [Planctomycetota bacterium]|nr:MAG: hypothetical protein D6744_05915 [Planctomycetota bacterium]
MSWETRDYYRTEERDWSGGARPSLPSPGVLTLLLLHATTFLIVAMMHVGEGRQLARMLSFHGGDSGWPAIIAHPYAFSTLQFGVAIGLAFTLYVVWILGSMIEREFGAARLLTLYVAGNLAAGIAFFALAITSPNAATRELNAPIGALAAWGMVGWFRFDDRLVMVFGRPMTFSRVIGWAAAIVVGLAILTGGAGSTAWTAAVVAGAGTGWLAEQLPSIHIGRLLASRRPKTRRRTSDEAASARPPRPARPTPPVEDDIDDVLAKISRSGIDSLTAEERERLEAARLARLRASGHSSARTRGK